MTGFYPKFCNILINDPAAFTFAVADSKHHVWHGVRPKWARRGHGEEDCPTRDKAGDSAE